MDRFTQCLILLAIAVSGYAQGSNLKSDYQRAVAVYQEDLSYRKDSLVGLLIDHITKYSDELGDGDHKLQVLYTIVDSLDKAACRKTLIQFVKEIDYTGDQQEFFISRYGKLEAEIIAVNLLLVDIVHKNLMVREDSSIVMDVDTNAFYDILSFLEVSDGDSILDIGTGFGLIPYVLGIVHENLQLGLNERDRRLRKYLRHELTANGVFKRSNRYAVVRGSNGDIGIRPEEYSKIMMLNTFHHLRRKKKILADVHRCIGSGTLYLFEQVLSERSCKKAMYAADIEDLLIGGGFEITDRQVTNGMLMLKCIATQTKD